MKHNSNGRPPIGTSSIPVARRNTSYDPLHTSSTASSTSSSSGLPRIITSRLGERRPSTLNIIAGNGASFDVGNPSGEGMSGLPSTASTGGGRRMSLDGNFKMPLSASQSGDKLVKKAQLMRVLHQIKSEENLASSDIEFERRINAESSTQSTPIIQEEGGLEDDTMMISPIIIQPSKLNPEHNYSSRLRYEMRVISPYSTLHNSIPSPIPNQKRKLSSAGLEDRHFEPQLTIGRITKPLKRARRTTTSFAVHHGHTKNNSGSSVASDVSMALGAPSDSGMDSPRISVGQGYFVSGMPLLNLGGTGTDFSKMKLS